MKSIKQKRNTVRGLIAMLFALAGTGLMWYLKPPRDATWYDIALIAPVSFFVTFLVYYAFTTAFKKYYACPYCDYSVLMIDKWQCSSCVTVQSEPRLFSDACEECLMVKETAFCDSCEKEFKI
ncbi:MAG: hypothetical protein ACR2PH_10475 [Desulfobulbia bacterium]